MIKFEMLSADNVEKVWELEKLCFDDPWELTSFTSELDNKISVYFAARDDENDRIVGYAGVWLMYDCANITNIAVASEYRREGLGGKMLDLLIDVSRERGMDSVTLEVRVSNIPAIALYEKYGFVKCGLRKKYYQGKEDALIMTLSLKEVNINENSCD